MTTAAETFPRALAAIRRRNLQAFAGILVMVLAAGSGAKVYSDARDRTPVLVASRSIELGVVITSTDLRVAEVAVDGNIEYVAASSRDAVIGKVATEPLYSGKLLTRKSFASSTSLPAGYVAMSVPLDEARAAGGTVRAADHVAVINSISADRGEPRTTILFTDVPVLSTKPSETAGGRVLLVTLRLRLEEARALAEALAVGEIHLVLLSRSSQ